MLIVPSLLVSLRFFDSKVRDDDVLPLSQQQFPHPVQFIAPAWAGGEF